MSESRASALFRALPDDVGRGAAYLSDDAIHGFDIITPTGRRQVGDVGEALAGADDVYIDLPLAKTPDRIPPTGRHHKDYFGDR